MHRRPLAPYRLQEVIESLERKYSVEYLDIIVKDVSAKILKSAFYQESKIDRDIPGEKKAKALFDDVIRNPE